MCRRCSGFVLRPIAGVSGEACDDESIRVQSGTDMLVDQDNGDVLSLLGEALESPFDL